MLGVDAAKNKNNLVVITDIRYDEYLNDEVSWLKEEVGGFLVHIEKFFNDGKDIRFVQPINEDESINNPKLRKKADFVLTWPNDLNEDKAKDYCKDVLIYMRLFKMHESLTTNKS